MPFLAECPFCEHRVQAPDQASGGCVPCPKCSSFFTLAPTTSVPQRTTPGAPSPSEEAVPAVGLPPLLAPGGSARVLPVNVAPHHHPANSLGAIDPLGLVAFALGLLALFGASAASLCVVVIPLSAFGLLLGLAAVLLAGLLRRRRLCSVLGSAMSGAVLVLALLSPDVLGPAFEASRQRERPDSTIRVIPHPEYHGASDLRDPEWVDASRADLQQNQLRLSVVSVALGSAASRAPSGKKKGLPETYLVVRLRSQRAGGEFAPGQQGGRAVRKEQLSPTLTDDKGKVYPPLSVDLGPLTDGGTHASRVFPVEVADEVFVFEVPAPGVESLRLEVPAAASVGRGAFRFTLLKAMIRPGLRGNP